ncbi:isocitrate lyase/phosphoenolpyruvate mutase family protein [Sphingoaurantiacus capsulatus]|uniref:Isocitrate lyase/phosphoenolpyruvate mutase family protein n=1 Tax=Sphingoaurantiacus capsulatus TaxID=1771310 RepID=A0ABV7XD99_9SPHN
MGQADRYERFKALHARPGAFIMPNVWDGGSAVLMKQAGFEALASSSIAIAFALGRQDGSHAVSREEAVANAALIGDLTDLPVNGDLEDGFGSSPEDCVATVEAAIAGGLAGLGIEDTTANPADPLHGFEAAVARVKAAAKAAKGRILLTGRTDNLLKGPRDLDETIRRLVAFAEAGADVLFAPGLPDLDAIRAVVKAVSPKPVNVVVGPGTGPVPLAALAEAGVRRVSLGGGLQRRAYDGLIEAATALKAGDIAGALPKLGSGDIACLLP